LFFYHQKFIDIDRIDPLIHILDELNWKQRKIRSLRGFFLYALEIMENGENYEILQTNLQPFFWKKVKNIIRQNKKAALQEFLFGKDEVNKDQTLGSNLAFQQMEKKIQNLQNQVTLLQQKVINLEAKLMTVEQNSKYPLSEPSRPLESSKTSQQGDSLSNDRKVNLKVKEPRHPISESLSEASQSPFKTVEQSEEYNKYTLRSRESPKSPKFYHFGEDSRTRENRNHSNRISTSSSRNNLIEEVLRK